MKRYIIPALFLSFVTIITFPNYIPKLEKSLCTNDDPASICVKNIIISKYLQSRGVELKGVGDKIAGPEFSPNGRTIAIEESTGWSLWNTLNGTKITTLIYNNERNLVTRIFFNNDGSKILIQDNSNSIRIYDCSTGKRLIDLMGLTDSMLAAAFSGDGSKVAASDRNGNVIIWQLLTGKLLGRISETLETRKSFIKSEVYGNLAFSPNENKLVLGGKNILLWDIDSGKINELGNYSIHADSIITFNKDGKYIIIWEYAGSIKIYNSRLDGLPSITLEMPSCSDNFLLFDIDNKIYMGGEECKEASTSFWSEWFGSSYSFRVFKIDLNNIVWGNPLDKNNLALELDEEEFFNIFKSSIKENKIIFARDTYSDPLTNRSTRDLLWSFASISGVSPNQIKKIMSLKKISLDGKMVCYRYKNHREEVKITINRLLTDKEIETLKLIDKCSDEQSLFIKKICVEATYKRRSMLSSEKTYLAQLRKKIQNATKREGILLTPEEKIIFKSLHKDIQILLIRLKVVQISWKDWLMSFVF